MLSASAATSTCEICGLGLYEIAALAAGGAIQAAQAGMEEPSFGLIRPPGHHASANSCWGYCYFNNMAVSLFHLRAKHNIERAFILDFDLHYGDGNVNILGKEPWVEILNPKSHERETYLQEVNDALEDTQADVIAVSAGFDHHVNDWGGVLYTEDYKTMGERVRETALRNGGGCYGLLEGGYNHKVLGNNVLAFLEGLQGSS
ncbi:MAG: histone deacetylase family protein [Thermodesulfobacteriota bacterium]|nr:histone deacetylase family protein [Thermodesulfobacteriota bacterium]